MFSKLLLFDGFSGTFRHIKLRERNPECSVCGDDPTIKELIDYEQFCGSKPNDKVHVHNDLLYQWCVHYRRDRKNCLVTIREYLVQ